MHKPALLLLFVLVAGPTASAQKPNNAAPPGTVYLKGGRTQVGNDVKTIEDMLEAAPAMQNFASGFVSETPMVRHDVSPFYLMVNELSNEQYAAFVAATSYRPPHLWGAAVIDLARRTYLEEQGRLRKEAHDAGEKLPEMIPFDPEEWWSQNWSDCEWEVPTKLAQSPVTFVDYQDARAYARWAGMRLMSESEFQHAARRGTDRVYPWGKEWSEQHCASMELNRAEALKIASFPDGATEDGIYDLSGNVWEWTSSRFMPFEGYKMQTFKFGRGRSKIEVSAMAKWDPNKRVAVGGSIQSPRQICRVTTRRGSDRFQKTSSLGFRCAASAMVGFDHANTILDDIPNEHRPSTAAGPVEYSPELVLAMDRWLTTSGSGSQQVIAIPGTDTTTPELPAEYAVITGYSYISFVPATAIPVASLKDLRKVSLDGDLVHLGVLATDQEIVDPPIGKGTWMVTFRAAGTGPEDRPAKESAEGDGNGEGNGGADEADEAGDLAAADSQRALAEAQLEFDTEVDNLILFDALGQPVTSFPVSELAWTSPKKPSLTPVDRIITVIVDEEEVEHTERWLELTLFLPGKSRKGIRFNLGLRFGEGVIDGPWRKN